MSTAMPPLYPGFDPSVLKKFRHSYNSFAPRVRVTWTPGQYYYMSGDRKINLYSKYPTVSVDWERGLSGIMHSTGKYERIEVDFQHNIPLGLMRDIYYRLGWGLLRTRRNSILWTLPIWRVPIFLSGGMMKSEECSSCSTDVGTTLRANMSADILRMKGSFSAASSSEKVYPIRAE